jgi:trehalose 6-phosphate phosphatase
MLPVPAPLTGDSWALFLDVDGTLLDIADAPDLVHVDRALLDLLGSAQRAAAGALALVSGRSIAGLDGLFAPLVLPAAGLHGAERRDAAGRLYRRRRDPMLAGVAGELRAWCESHPGTLLEDKQGSIALHYRLAPADAPRVREAAVAALQRLGEGYVLLEGKSVVELRPSGTSKAHAIEAFMAEAPFAGRRPVFVGDDVTDEDGFRWVAQAGGIAVIVGGSSPTSAEFRLGDVAAVRDWLGGFAGERQEGAE